MSREQILNEIICPNCACHLYGEANEKGVTHITCRRCRARINSKRLGPKIYVMRITAP